MCTPNDTPQEPNSHYNCDGGHHNIGHSWVQKLDNVVHVRTHEVDDLASLNGLLRPVGTQQTFLTPPTCPLKHTYHPVGLM